MKVRRSLYAAFLLWPVGAGILFAGLVPFVFGESGPTRLLSLVFIIIGMSFNGLWAFYIDRSGMAQRVHDFLGLTQNPFTGRYGATQKEIEADARRVRDSASDKKQE
ncbi:hypothetical protein [Pseudomonas fluorescens]